MAGDARLSRAAAPGPGLLLAAAGVLAVHLLVLDWFAGRQIRASVLAPQATPMFTRLLVPAEPPPASVFKPKVAKPRAGGSFTAINSIANSTPTEAVTAAAPAAAVPEAVAAPPEAASAQAPTTVPDTSDAAMAASTPTTPSPTAPVAAAAPDSWPADTRLSYTLSGRFRSGELYGDARVQWQRDGERYQARIDIALRPFIQQSLTSQGRVGPDGLVPGAYEETRSNRHRSVQLQAETILLENGRSVPRPPGVQDTASQFVELGHRFASGRDVLEVGRSVSFWMARPGAVDLWTYDVVARDMLRTARLGEIEAFHLKPRPIANPRGNITAEMWFAPSLQYLPVRIRVLMGDEAMVDLLVDTIEQR